MHNFSVKISINNIFRGNYSAPLDMNPTNVSR